MMKRFVWFCLVVWVMGCGPARHDLEPMLEATPTVEGGVVVEVRPTTTPAYTLETLPSSLEIDWDFVPPEFERCEGYTQGEPVFLKRAESGSVEVDTVRIDTEDQPIVPIKFLSENELLVIVDHLVSSQPTRIGILNLQTDNMQYLTDEDHKIQYRTVYWINALDGVLFLSEQGLHFIYRHNPLNSVKLFEDEDIREINYDADEEILTLDVLHHTGEMYIRKLVSIPFPPREVVDIQPLDVSHHHYDVINKLIYVDKLTLKNEDNSPCKFPYVLLSEAVFNENLHEFSIDWVYWADENTVFVTSGIRLRPHTWQLVKININEKLVQTIQMESYDEQQPLIHGIKPLPQTELLSMASVNFNVNAGRQCGPFCTYHTHLTFFDFEAQNYWIAVPKSSNQMATTVISDEQIASYCLREEDGEPIAAGSNENGEIGYINAIVRRSELCVSQFRVLGE